YRNSPPIIVSRLSARKVKTGTATGCFENIRNLRICRFRKVADRFLIFKKLLRINDGTASAARCKAGYYHPEICPYIYCNKSSARRTSPLANTEVISAGSNHPISAISYFWGRTDGLSSRLTVK